jgi:hypothetical protein
MEPPVVRPLNSFPAFYGTQKFITEFTRPHHLFLSWARPIQSTSPHPTSHNIDTIKKNKTVTDASRKAGLQINVEKTK